MAMITALTTKPIRIYLFFSFSFISGLYKETKSTVIVVALLITKLAKVERIPTVKAIKNTIISQRGNSFTSIVIVWVFASSFAYSGIVLATRATIADVAATRQLTGPTHHTVFLIDFSLFAEHAVCIRYCPDI